MRYSFKSLRAETEPAKAKHATKSGMKPTVAAPNLRRLAFDLAAEWCSGGDDSQRHPFEMTS
jgi:hypothetical protein